MAEQTCADPAAILKNFTFLEFQFFVLKILTDFFNFDRFGIFTLMMTRKYPLRWYILGVQTPINAQNSHLGRVETLKLLSMYLVLLLLTKNFNLHSKASSCGPQDSEGDLQWSNLIPARSHFFESIIDSFLHFSQNQLEL